MRASKIAAAVLFLGACYGGAPEAVQAPDVSPEAPPAPEPEPAPAPAPETPAEPEPEPAPAPTPEPERAADAAVEPETVPEPEAAPDVVAEPSSEPAPAPVVEPDPEPEPETVHDPCAPGAAARSFEVTLPLGETLFFDGDDYLAFWDPALACGVEIASKPESASAVVAGAGLRLTPDVPGAWTLVRGADTVEVTVDAGWLTPDTFLNFNYTAEAPLARAAGDLWVASPPSNAVQRVVTAGGDPEAAELVPTGSWPTAILAWESEGVLLVSQTGRDSVGFLDLGTRRVVDAIRVGNEPSGLALDTAGETPILWVALAGEDHVARVDLEARVVTHVLPTGREPRALALDAATGRLFVASLISGNEHPHGPLQKELVPAEDERDVTVVDTVAVEVVGHVHRVGTIVRGLALDPTSPGRLVVAVSHSRNTIPTIDAEQHPIGHALVFADVDPASPTDLEVTGEIDLDHQPTSTGPAASPFSIAWDPGGTTIAVALSAGGSILLLDAASFEEVGRLPTGSGPRGLLWEAERLLTLATFDDTLHAWTFDPETAAAGPRTDLAIGADPMPLEVRQGQRMFNDAAFSKYGEFSCGNCHIDGLTDGLVWDLLTDGPVNTLAFRNVGGTSPFLWGGQLPTLFDFSREVLKLVGATASGAQMHLLTTYLQSVTAPPNPWALPGGRLTPAAKAGRKLFEKAVEKGGAGCTKCHAGELMTNRKLELGKSGVPTDVPSLFGAYDTGPWGRYAQWATLADIVSFAAPWNGAYSLTPDELASIVAYVREQPSDRLYLTSSTPLHDSHHVWYETPVELVWSAVLRPGQEDRFTMSRVASPEPGSEVLGLVAGVWEVSGRYVRFAPGEPFELMTTYRIDIEPGLEGVLGPVTKTAIAVTFTTGGVPLVDVSGTWSIDLCHVDYGCGGSVLALIQSEGGQVTGVVMENFDEGSVDHVEGVVDGHVLALDPFTVQTDIVGPVFVEKGVSAEVVDDDQDGWGDSAAGKLEVEVLGGYFEVEVYLDRLGFPEGVTPD